MSLILILNKNAVTTFLEDTFQFSDAPEFGVIPFNNIIYQCPILPPIAIRQAISTGQNSHAQTLIGFNFLVYTTDNLPNKIVGTYTSSIFDSEVEALGNQPVFANISNNNVCAFNPVIQYFNGNIVMAWLENNSAGRLDLKFGDTPVTVNPNVTVTLPESVYVRAYVNENLGLGVESNIPLNKLTLIDAYDDVFDLTTSQDLTRGFNVQLPGAAKAVRFVQLFKINNAKINALITTVPSQTYLSGNAPLNPISGAVVNIYAGKTNQSLITRAFTDEFGTFTATIPYAGEYLFEIEISNNNLLYQQQIL